VFLLIHPSSASSLDNSAPGWNSEPRTGEKRLHARTTGAEDYSRSGSLTLNQRLI